MSYEHLNWSLNINLMDLIRPYLCQMFDLTSSAIVVNAQVIQQHPIALRRRVLL